MIDTNIFLEILLGRDRKDECKKLLRLIRDGKKTGVVTDFTIHSIIVIMDGLKRLRELKTFLTSLTAYKGLHTYITSLADEAKAVDLAIKHGLDMDDAIQYSAALTLKVEAIVSFDKHFDSLKIPRREPAEITPHIH
ncbi:MAG: hypothetical protein DRN60_01040 [Thaumarchaeota archaeon]|nr:MAG: hypothetical protein DRN60_01040 [Nitrososphaerota archaeon]